jgi:CBS domain-containing protein
MRIEAILRNKGTDVATVRAETSVADAAQMLTTHRVGALVVSPDGSHIAGILSERDIARGVAEHGSAVVDLTVEDLMTVDVQTCAAGDTVDQLMATMTERRIRHLPVVDDGTLAGIISIGDVVKWRLGELEQENHTLHDYIVLGR